MTSFEQHIEVAAALPVDRTFTYGVPSSLAGLIMPGKRVLVPFGRRRITGYVLGPAEPSNGYKIKRVLDVLDDMPLFPMSMTPFFRWVADYYLYPVGEVIRCALPGGLNLYEYVTFSLTPGGETALSGTMLNPTEREVMELLRQGNLRPREISGQLGRDVPWAMLQNLERNQWIGRGRELRGGETRTRMERYVTPGKTPVAAEKLSASRQKILNVLAGQKEISVRSLKEYVPTAASLIRAMAEQGQVTILEKPVYRDPFGEPIEPDTPPQMTSEQEAAVRAVQDALDGGFQTFLLAGVTGSGKTEVYLRLTESAIESGKNALVLVPEIALISQMERRFRSRFGEQVAVLHSGLSAGERYDQWKRILREETRIVIGARSAVFAPFERVGLVIVDEEHDTSYKQGSDLLYNARDLAVVRAKMDGGIALLGSATPSVQSCYNVRAKKFRELVLSRRVEQRPLPRITLVDLRKQRDVRGARRFISPVLHKAMTEVLDRGEQVLLFLNRRGFASFPVCAACGDSVRCAHCDITLTMHRLESAYRCHYCGYSREATPQCPTCKAPRVQLLGMGTEKVEAAVKALFPAARVARMDRDTTTRKGSVLRILKTLKNRAIDVLVGTQMVTKGHDFPGITLVGVICADLSLSFPDFRAGERTFQLLAQVAGRAGRGDVPGRMILQTYTPDHFSIQAARAQDFRAFYNTEIGFRRALDYPPFTRMIQLKISGKEADETRGVAEQLGTVCRDVRVGEGNFTGEIEILGPIEASITRIADWYRWQILLKGRRVNSLHRFVRRLNAADSSLFNHPRVRVVVDVDPFFMS